MTSCELCKRTIYQTIFIRQDKSGSHNPIVFDAYCISCRGLFDYYTRVKGVAEPIVKQALNHTYAPKEFRRRTRWGLETGGIVVL